MIGLERRNHRYHAFQWPYVGLLFISIVFFFAYIAIQIRLSNSQALLNWTGRLSASIFGAYLTSILVDGVFRERERERKESIQQTAFQALAPDLHRQQVLIELLYRVGAPEPVSEMR